MKISVITACYNSAGTIEGAINSLLSQQLNPGTELEYIIIDGLSTDNSLEIVGRYKEKIAKTISEKDRGIYDALNKGIAAASGDVIGFLHSDDAFYSTDSLQAIADAFQTHGCDAVYGNGVYISNDGSEKVIRNWVSGELSTGRLERGWMPMHPTFFVKRDIYRQYGSFNDTYRISADYDIVLRFLKIHRIKTAYINKYLIKMKIGGASNTFKNLIRKWKEDFSIMQNHGLNPYIALAWKNLSKVKQLFSR
jgi:glycosyltransferase